MGAAELVILFRELLGEQEIDQHRSTDDDTNDGEDDHHADAHVLQVLQKGHGIELKLHGAACQKEHDLHLPSAWRQYSE